MQGEGRAGGEIACRGVLCASEENIPVPEGLRWLTGLPGGSAWLSQLPELVAGCVRDWQLTVDAPIRPGSVSWVAPAELSDGAAAVLKLSYPDRESEHESDALGFWADRGAVRLLAYDGARRAMLLERCIPVLRCGTSPTKTPPTASRRTSCGASGDRPPATAPFRALAAAACQWSQELPGRYARHRRPFARRLLDEAVRLCDELAASQSELVVCHQDFHGGNVLFAGERGWLAIDPKPLVGERAFDLASLLRDRRETLLSGPTPGRVVRRRLELLSSELSLERERMRGWGIVHAVAWGLGDDEVYRSNIACAELLAAC